MTNALAIPHFGFSQTIDVTALNSIRREMNIQLKSSGSLQGQPVSKLTPLPFIAKAISHVFKQHRKVNAHLDTATDPRKPKFVIKGSHNFGIAVDTPQGLRVPVVQDVQNHSIISLAAEINRLTALAKEGRLAPSDMRGATFTISNIGSIGGQVVGPIIVPPMVAIVGLGKIEEVPVFQKSEDGSTGTLVKREKLVLSWSADHRILDGASVARCGQAVEQLLENWGLLACF
jgi:2-oxoisovalerate dehydrogenase E2 component (dihydrolipoyl transacylase)